MFGIFFFLTIFVQEVLGYSALKSGRGVPAVRRGGRGDVRASCSQVIGRTGARPLMLAGTTIAAGGMFWFSQLTVHSDYVGGLLGPMLVTSIGLGMLFVPLSLVALNRVRGEDSGVASSLLNTGQQVGGAIGLAALGTVTWTAVANNVKHQAAVAAGHAGQALPAGRPLGGARRHPAPRAGVRDRARVPGRGRDRGARVPGRQVTIRVRRSDLTGAIAAPTPASEVDRRSIDPEFPEATI